MWIINILQIYSSVLPLRRRTTSESRLDTTSVGRVRTHSGCNPNISPFHIPFSPPMSPYMVHSQSTGGNAVSQKQCDNSEEERNCPS